MRADRLIAILILLKNNGKMSARDLAKRLEVSIRTVHRDMESLISSGMPLMAERGKAGGWRLIDNWSHQLSWLKNAEIESLFVPHSYSLLNDLGLDEASVEARKKLLACMPDSLRHDAELLSERIYIDMNTWRGETERIQSLKTIQQAIWHCRKLRMSYQNSDGQINEREIEPLGLVSKSAKWYLVAKREDTYRTYRASRILSAGILDDVFLRPAGFDLAKYWAESKAGFIKRLPEYRVNVVVSPSAIDRLKKSGRFVQIENRKDITDNDWIPLTLCFELESEALEHILSFGHRIKVTSPEDLKAKVVDSARSVVRLYERRPYPEKKDSG